MKALLINYSNTDILNEYFSYFLEENILSFNQCNKETF